MLKDSVSSSPVTYPETLTLMFVLTVSLFSSNFRAHHSSHSNMSYFNTFALFFLLHKTPILDKINLCVLVPGWLNIPGEKITQCRRVVLLSFCDFTLLTDSLSCPEYISPFLSSWSPVLQDGCFTPLSSSTAPLKFPSSLSAVDRTLCFENQRETPQLWCSWRTSLRLSCSFAIILTSLW